MLPLIFLLLSSSAVFRVSASSSTIYDVDVDGYYTWELYLDIDNSGNAGIARKELHVVTSVVGSYKSMKKALQSENSAGSLAKDLEGSLFEVTSLRVKGELSDYVKAEYEKLSEGRPDFRKESTHVQVHEVEPHSHKKLYRKVFNAPGLSYLTSTLSFDPAEESVAVPINFKIKQIHVLKDIEVVYSEDLVGRPAELIREVRGDNPDVNAGFGGKYVWLVPVWSRNAGEGATGIEVIVQSTPSENEEDKDLASGAGGAYRYVRLRRNPESNNKRITEVGLFRSKKSNDSPQKAGWEYVSRDINQGRKKDYLYLVYAVKLV